MQMTERKMNEGGNQMQDNNNEIKETKFGGKSTIHSAQITLTDPKLEKKVTFARLLNKVSAEMSSGSDMELGIMQSGRLGYAFARPASTPPSPIVDPRSPNSTSSNQGSDSLTSSDLAIPSALSCSLSDFLGNRRQGRLPGKQNPQVPTPYWRCFVIFRPVPHVQTHHLRLRFLHRQHPPLRALKMMHQEMMTHLHHRFTRRFHFLAGLQKVLFYIVKVKVLSKYRSWTRSVRTNLATVAAISCIHRQFYWKYQAQSISAFRP